MKHTPIYTADDWFKLAKKTFTTFLSPLKGKDNLLFMEIGVFEGRSAIWQLNNILTGQNCKILCVDAFYGSPEHNSMGVNLHELRTRFEYNLKPYVGKYQILEGLSKDVLRTKEYDNKIDVCYIDGSHTAYDVLTDMCLVYPMLKNGGLMICDDYMWNYNNLPTQSTPFIAINSFMNCFKGKIQALQLNWKTVVLQKI